jgi:hypothetical protein
MSNIAVIFSLGFSSRENMQGYIFPRIFKPGKHAIGSNKTTFLKVFLASFWKAHVSNCFEEPGN